MPRYLQIQIPEACHEKWENMAPHAQGNFCHSCSKTVIDFSSMTDEQLLAFFKKKPANVCGRFNEQQLSSSIPLPSKQIPWLKYFFQIMLPAWLFGYDSQAQSKPRKQNKAAINSTASHPSCTVSLPDAELKRRLSGIVTNSHGAPVAYASVVIKGQPHGTEADSLGNFSLLIGEDVQWLEVSAVGYNTIEVDLSTKDKFQPMAIAMEHKEMLPGVGVTADLSQNWKKVYLGGISYAFVNHIQNTTPLLQPPTSTARLTAFPNPASINEWVTIRFETPVTHDQELALYHTNGALLRRMSIQAKPAITQVQLRMQVPSAGNYFISITDQLTKKKEIVQIVVR